MTVYVVSYVLVKKEKRFDYEALVKEFERIGALKTQETVWLVKAKNTAKEVCEHLKALMHADDRLWVSAVPKGQFHYANALPGTGNWFEENAPT
jgi:hypothetical protein